MKLNDLIEAVIIREGEFIDRPDDRGGPTRYGITEIIARSQGYLGSVCDLPRDTAIEIYERIYWRRPKLAAIHDCAPHLAYRMFNLYVDVGPATAIGFLRRGLNALNRNCDEAENIPPTPIVDTNPTFPRCEWENLAILAV
jgi:lysozyme family protein